MSETRLKQKLVAITDSKAGQSILDREWWARLESLLGWRLYAFTGRLVADFFTVSYPTDDGVVWDGRETVTCSLRHAILVALGREDVSVEGHLPLAPIIEFSPRNSPAHNN